MESEAIIDFMSIIISLIYDIVGLGVTVFQYVCLWKIFVKAGQEGWKALIPVYNAVVLFKLIGLSPYLLLLYLIPFVFIFIMVFAVALMAIGSEIASIVFAIILGIFILIIMGVYALNVVYMVHLGKAFNKSTAFIVGLVLVPVVFQAILAFDKQSVYGLKKKEELIEEKV